MKTVIQELKEEIQSKVFQSTNLTDYQYGHNVAYGVVLTILEYLLEKEKEQFDDMFDEGFESAYQHFVNGKDFVKFEDYYNQVYNQNK